MSPTQTKSTWKGKKASLLKWFYLSYNEPVVFAIVLSQLNKAKAELSRSGNASEIRLHADKRHIHSQRLSDLLSTRFHPPIPCRNLFIAISTRKIQI